MNLISHNILFPALVEDASHPYYDECCGLLSGGGLAIREIQAELVWMYFGSVTSGGHRRKELCGDRIILADETDCATFLVEGYQDDTTWRYLCLILN